MRRRRKMKREEKKEKKRKERKKKEKKKKNKNKVRLKNISGMYGDLVGKICKTGKSSEEKTREEKRRDV